MVALRPYQQEAVSAVRSEWAAGNRATLLVCATGCHEPSQGILMADGSVKQAKDIVVGDLLMGPDGTPRSVLRLHSGTDEMYKVIPVKGKPFVVNSQHLLQVVQTNRGGKSCMHDGETSTIKACDWERQSKTYKHVHKLYRADEVACFAGNDGSAVTVDPYFLGVLLGDGGMSTNISITTLDDEIVSVIYDEARKRKMQIRIDPAGKANTYHLARVKGTQQENQLIKELKALDLHGKTSDEKFVPHYYKTLPIKQRIEVLAGLLDTDGSATDGGYDFISKSKQLSSDVAFLARSVGLAAYVKQSEKGIKSLGFVGTYWRVSISGDTDKIPMRVEHKRQAQRLQKKSVLRTGFAVEHIGTGQYNGFTVDGDNLYLLDDFTVTHNCGKTVVFSEIARRCAERGNRTLVVAHRGELIDQAAAKLAALGVPVSVEQASRHFEDDSMAVVASVQTLQGRRLEAFPLESFSSLIIDEAHHSVSKSYRAIIDRHKAAGGFLLGVTATADRADRRGLSEVYDSIAYEYPLQKAVAEGYLSPIRAKCLPLAIDISKVKVSGGDYQAGELGSALDPYLPEIASVMAKECAGRKTVCFLPLVSTSERMADELNAAGLRAVAASGYDSAEERAAKKDAFERGEYDVLCNSMLYCLDTETEILTNRGFVSVDEYRGDDLVANWNFDGSVFFEKAHEFIRRPLYEHEHMVSIDSRTINLRVTNTHRMVVSCGEGRKQWKKDKAENLRNGLLLPTCGVADPFDVEPPRPPYERLTHIRVDNGELSHVKPSDLTLDECRFIGFFLAEGHICHLQSGGVEYRVCQTRDKYPRIIEWFDRVIDRCGFDSVRKEGWKETNKATMVNWSFCRGTGHGSQQRKGLFKIEPYLEHDGTTLFWGLDERQFDALIEGFWYGDGFHGSAENGMPESIVIRGCYQKLFDLWCAIGSVRGWRCAVYERPQKNPKHSTQYELRMIKGKPLNISYKTPIDHQGRQEGEEVWCVRTTSKNIITRRKGRVVVMGNTEGWDCPAVDCVVMLRPTKSRSLYCQMVGRGTRLAPNKSHLLLLDFLWMTDKHDLCRPASLLGKSGRVAEVMQERFEDGTDWDIEKAAEEADRDVAAERERTLAEELERQRRKKKKLVDPLQFAMSIAEADLADYVPTRLWEFGEVTAKQREALERCGIDWTGCENAGQASVLIDALARRGESGMATPKQIRALERVGFERVGTWTKEQASSVIGRYASAGWKPWKVGIDPKAYDPRVAS